VRANRHYLPGYIWHITHLAIGEERLRIKAVGWEVIGKEGFYELGESDVSYEANFGPENGDLRQENAFFWDEST